ncbi:MAG TPA: winged helix-turn-helix transcriptional regulator, partial [Gammaproteobacteria bacterium]
MGLDSTDVAILNILQQDARISNVSLADRIGLSEAACLRRVRALEKTGYIDAYVGL